MSQFSFDEVVDYILGLRGRDVRVHARSANRSETSAFLAGEVTVHSSPAGRPPTNLYRHYCQVGENAGTGFTLAPHDVESARIDLYDPESLAVSIKFKQTDLELVIPDERLTSYDMPLPTGP